VCQGFRLPKVSKDDCADIIVDSETIVESEKDMVVGGKRANNESTLSEAPNIFSPQSVALPAANASFVACPGKRYKWDSDKSYSFVPSAGENPTNATEVSNASNIGGNTAEKCGTVRAAPIDPPYKHSLQLKKRNLL
jgi:hypothetical protein